MDNDQRRAHADTQGSTFHRRCCVYSRRSNTFIGPPFDDDARYRLCSVFVCECVRAWWSICVCGAVSRVAAAALVMAVCRVVAIDSRATARACMARERRVRGASIENEANRMQSIESDRSDRTSQRSTETQTSRPATTETTHAPNKRDGTRKKNA